MELITKKEYLICVGGNWNIAEYFEGNWYIGHGGCYSSEWLDKDEPIIPLDEAISFLRTKIHKDTTLCQE